MKNSRIAVILLLVIASLAIFTLVKGQKTTPSPTTTTVKPTPTTLGSPTNSPVTLSQGKTPSIPFKLPNGFTIHIFAASLGNPRDLVFSPGGTLLVSNPISNKVFALPDKNNDGVADSTKTVINSGNHVHGLAFYNGQLFVAEVNKVVRYNWDENSLTATLDKVLFSLPNNNDHNNHTIIFTKDGTMSVSVGSTCNVCSEKSDLSAAILAADKDGNNLHVFAKGLRNAPFMAFNPLTNELWATEMGRDYLGDNLPPDEIDIIKNGLDYGWPFCYGTKIQDTNFDKSGSHPCNNTEPPIFEIPAHNAPLGLAFINSKQFSKDWQNDLLVSYHGSWNRSIPDGYKVVHLKIKGGKIISSEDFLTGFIQGRNVSARPVDLIFDNNGNLYLSDDKSGNIYIIQKN